MCRCCIVFNCCQLLTIPVCLIIGVWLKWCPVMQLRCLFCTPCFSCLGSSIFLMFLFAPLLRHLIAVCCELFFLLVSIIWALLLFCSLYIIILPTRHFYLYLTGIKTWGPILVDWRPWARRKNWSNFIFMIAQVQSSMFEAGLPLSGRAGAASPLTHLIIW